MSDATPIVFIVDDDVSVRESLELLIESAGWLSQTFASAQEFLAHPPVHAGPSCLVLDVNLPGVTGLQLQECLAVHRLDMPVIVISGYDAGEATARAISAGAVAFLTKPLDAAALLRAIELAINGSPGTFGREGLM
jgi:FixJ family two-component response regulator